VRTFNLKDARPMRDLNPSDIDKMVAIRGRARQMLLATS
jgi:DNA replication licensing factor MCM4